MKKIIFLIAILLSTNNLVAQNIYDSHKNNKLGVVEKIKDDDDKLKEEIKAMINVFYHNKSFESNQIVQPNTGWIYYKDVNMYLRVEQEYPNGKTNALIYEKRASVYEKYVGEFRYLQVHYYVGQQYIVVDAYQNRRYNQTKDFYGKNQYVTSSGWYFSL